MPNIEVHWGNAGWEGAPDANIMVRGTAFHRDRILRGRELAEPFEAAEPAPEAWSAILAQCNGFFAIAGQTIEATIVAVDRVRSIPVFYGQHDGTVYISDDAEWVRQRVGDAEMDPLAREEFQLAGYVTGPDTLYPKVKQIQAGELLRVSHGDQPKLSLHRWYRFTHSEPEHWDEPTLREELDQSAEASVRRLAEYANGRQIIIPLSGGYDSRLIALLLKRIGYENILTFTYGIPGNKESEYSRRVAKSLALPWHFIEYSPRKWRSAWQTEERLDYQRWASGWACLPHVQDWLAVRELKAAGIADADAVFCPGHTGDFISGGHIPSDFVPGEYVSHQDFATTVIKKHLSLAPWRLVTHRPVTDWIDRILGRAEAGSIQTAVEAADSFEKWEWQERQAKFIVNSVRVYEFFGYDWWLPLWDAEFMRFWRDVPLDLRRGKEWYVSYVKSVYARAEAVDLGNASDASGTAGKRWLKGLYHWLPGSWKKLARRCRTPATSSNALEGRYGVGEFQRLLKEDYSKNGMAAYWFLKDFEE